MSSNAPMTFNEFNERLKKLREDKKDGNVKRLEVTGAGIASVPERQLASSIYSALESRKSKTNNRL